MRTAFCFGADGLCAPWADRTSCVVDLRGPHGGSVADRCKRAVTPLCGRLVRQSVCDAFNEKRVAHLCQMHLPAGSREPEGRGLGTVGWGPWARRRVMESSGRGCGAASSSGAHHSTSAPRASRPIPPASLRATASDSISAPGARTSAKRSRAPAVKWRALRSSHNVARSPIASRAALGSASGSTREADPAADSEVPHRGQNRSVVAVVELHELQRPSVIMPLPGDDDLASSIAPLHPVYEPLRAHRLKRAAT